MKIKILFLLLSLFSFNCKKESNSSGIETKPKIYTVTIEGTIINNNQIGLDSVILNLQNPFRFDTTTTNGTFSISFSTDEINEISTGINIMRQSYHDTLIYIKYGPSKNKISLPEVIIRNVMDTNNQSNKVIMPLKVGNTWIFKLVGFNVNGDSIYSDTAKISIKADTIINGIKWYLMESTVGFFMNSVYRNDNLGLHKGSLSGSELWLFPYPSQPGPEIISIDTVYHIPLGNYHCYLYLKQNNEAFLHNLFSPNVGPIHLEESFSTIHGTSYVSQRMDLINVILK